MTLINANTLSVNMDKTKFVFFHKLRIRDDTPLKSPELRLNNNFIEREGSFKFLDVFLDENLIWN